MKDKKTTSFPKEKIKILFLENINPVAVKQFKDAGYTQIRSISGALSHEQLKQEIKDVHILGIRSKTQIDERILKEASKLQAIGCFCIGVNQVDLLSANRHGVAVFNAPYSNTRSVAELVIGTSIMLVRNILEKNVAAHNGLWNKESKGSHEIRGKTMGIVGYGNIGSQVSVLAESLGMRVIFFDSETKLPLGNAIACSNLKELLRKSDVVSLHVPELKSTKNLIGKTTIGMFKKGAVLINFSRGGIVDLNILKTALENKIIKGAALDVFPFEPEKNGDAFDCILKGMPNVFLTPHIGGSTEEAQENIGMDVSNKLFNYLEKGISIGSHSIPALSLPLAEGTHRILHIHKNVPGVLSQVNASMSKHGINILGQYLKTNEEIGYVVLDVDKHLSKQAVSLLRSIKETIRVRELF